MHGNENGSRAEARLSRAEGGREGLLHASAVAWGAAGILILGSSGAGKSGLVLRLMAQGADLVADDQVLLRRRGKRLRAEAPEPLRGLVEARQVGLLRVPHVASAPVALAVDLERTPEGRMPEACKITLLGCNIRLICGCGVPNLDAIITVIAQKRATVV